MNFISCELATDTNVSQECAAAKSNSSISHGYILHYLPSICRLCLLSICEPKGTWGCRLNPKLICCAVHSTSAWSVSIKLLNMYISSIYILYMYVVGIASSIIYKPRSKVRNWLITCWLIHQCCWATASCRPVAGHRSDRQTDRHSDRQTGTQTVRVRREQRKENPMNDIFGHAWW